MSQLAIFLVALCIGGSQACSCFFQTEDERYCNSKYAILAYVTNEDRPEAQSSNNGQIFINPFGQVTYTMNVLAIFRNEDHPITLGVNSFTTASNGAACGIFLQTGQYYFIAGGEGFGLYSCGPIFYNLSNFQQFLKALELVFQPPSCPVSPPILVAEAVEIAE